MNVVMYSAVCMVKTECIILPMSIVGTCDTRGISNVFAIYPNVANQYYNTINSNRQNVDGIIGKDETISVDNDGLQQDIVLIYCRSPMGNNWDAYLDGVKHISEKKYKSATIYVPRIMPMWSPMERQTINRADGILGECQMDIWFAQNEGG